MCLNAQDHQGQTKHKQAIQPVRSTPSWAEAIGRTHDTQQLVPHRTPMYHTVSKDADYHYPFELTTAFPTYGQIFRIHYEMVFNRDGLQTFISSGTGSYKGAAPEPPYGGAHRDKKAARH